MPRLINRLVNRLNPIYQWNIHSENYDLKAEVRKAIYNHPTLKRFVSYNPYRSPEAVGGWAGSFSAPIIGCLAFKSLSEGEISFRW